MSESKPLTSLRPGQKGLIESIEDQGSASMRLLELGLLPGAPVHFLRSAPLGDPMQVQVRDTCLSLCRREARGVRVRLMQG